MNSELSIRSRVEVTSGYAKAYARASKKDKGRILDQVVEVTGVLQRVWAATGGQCGKYLAASIDRYLQRAKAADQVRGASTTKPSPLLRSSITIRRAGDEVEAEPGFFEGDIVAHCGPTLKGATSAEESGSKPVVDLPAAVDAEVVSPDQQTYDGAAAFPDIAATASRA